MTVLYYNNLCQVPILCFYYESLFQCDYHLKGIVSVEGDSISTRHYKTYQYSVGKWFLFDDKIVTQEAPSLKAPWYLARYEKGKSNHTWLFCYM